MADDPLADYNSEEDEDYVPDFSKDDGDDGYGFAGDEGSGAVGGKGRGKKRSAPALLSRERLPLDGGATKKKKAATRVGAAVLSDDEDLFQPPPPPSPRSTPQPLPHHSQSSALPPSSTDDSPQPSVSASSADEVEAAGVSPATGLEETLTATPAASLPPSSTSASASPPSPTPPPQPSAAASPSPAKSGSDMASLLAQFNKKPTKPVVKKVLNSWELPVKPKPSPSLPSASSSPPTSATPAAVVPSPHDSQSLPSTATAEPTAASDPSSPPATAPSASSALSTEEVRITDFTSYAGQSLAVTRTLIKGSAEEKAHRAARQDNLASLVSSLSAKKGINTLEKSRLDWSVSKAEEGDEEELKAFVGSKDALVDRMAFLAKADRRQWEKQKESRDEARKQTMAKSTAGMDED